MDLGLNLILGFAPTENHNLKNIFNIKYGFSLELSLLLSLPDINSPLGSKNVC